VAGAVNAIAGGGSLINVPALLAVGPPATIVGGYGGATLARRMSSKLLRNMIVVFAFGVGIVLAVQAFA
jgi:uncharacterized membrane protein YfcA